MSSFDLYIHGTPNGHQIWGSSKNRDYISTFYNHDNIANDKSALQIDILLGDSFYTYIHQNDVYDSNNRPGAFFAITVSFSKSYCTNVYKLYKIFESVYDQVCVGKIILQEHNKEKYLVSEFESSRSGNNATVDTIKAIFTKNIAEHIEPFLKPLTNISNTFDKPKKQFSLLEVDSPLFFDFFKKQSIIVLPNIEPASKANLAITKQLEAVTSQKKVLEEANSKLQSKIAALTKDNKNLSDQLHVSASSSINKYSSTNDQLKADLNAATQANDKLQAKIEAVKSSINLINKPVQELNRLLECQFPEIDEPFGISQKSHSNKWNLNLNRNRKLIIVLSLVLSFAVLYLLKDCKPGGGVLHTDTTDSIPNQTAQHDKWEDCYIDIVEVKDEYSKHKYKLGIKKKDNKANANVPQGHWEVKIDENGPAINTNEYFIVPIGTAANTNLLIQYIVNNKAKINSTIQVK